MNTAVLGFGFARECTNNTQIFALLAFQLQPIAFL
jgi:hypothetical protein